MTDEAPVRSLWSYHVMGDCDGPGRCEFCPPPRRPVEKRVRAWKPAAKKPATRRRAK